jgi:CheY-like chemotaxis protein
MPSINHARARHIEAEITYGERLFRLRIRDDGEGIPPDILATGRSGHYGLNGMRERARQTGAKLDVWSSAGTGTEIELSIPASIAYRKSPGSRVLGLFRRKAANRRSRFFRWTTTPSSAKGFAAPGQPGIKFRLHRPEVTLMDLQMPALNGIAAISAIRSEFPDARIIVLWLTVAEGARYEGISLAIFAATSGLGRG